MFARASRLTFSLAATAHADLEPGHLQRPGPAAPVVLAGARLVANYPVSVITDGMGLNITVMSYDGHLDFGIVADREQMRDVWDLIGWLSESLEELGESAFGARPPAHQGIGGADSPANPPKADSPTPNVSVSG